MKKIRFFIPKSLISLCFILFISIYTFSQSRLVDPDATPVTNALYENLKQNMGKGVMFGHQDDLAYGVGWNSKDGMSDVKGSCGHYPAVFGWEVSKLGQRPYNIDSVNFERMKVWIRQGFNMGSMITISWHMDNPVSGGSAWDKTRAVYSIIPGGPKHAEYKKKLDLFADFIKEINSGNNGKEIPILFRPFHEHTGNWFWWGDGNCTTGEYIALWQFTVKYLRDVKNLHNLIYVYSTDIFRDKDQFLKFYPGDDYVDVLAFDDYHGIESQENLPSFTSRLHVVCELAKARDKVAALSETGLNQVRIPDWYTDYLLKGIKADPEGMRISYVLTWRNADQKQFFTTYPGHASQADFRKFYDDPYTWFQGDFPSLYKMPANSGK
jgi:mannan endo-1,4-beta-mannosidase